MSLLLEPPLTIFSYTFHLFLNITYTLFSALYIISKIEYIYFVVFFLTISFIFGYKP